MTEAMEYVEGGRMDNVKIRLMKPEDLEKMPHFWSEEVGIPMELNVMKRWYLLDPEGFRVAVEASGRIVGMAAAVKQCESMYLMGYLGVAIKYRNNGIAKLLYSNLISRCPDANFGLSASSDKVSMFTRRGFKKVENTYAFAYLGKFCDSLADTEKPTGLQTIRVMPGDENVSQLAAYDQDVAGFVRNIKLILLGDPSSVVIMLKKDGKTVGFGKMQHYIMGGAWLGPVYADDCACARVIIDALLKSFRSQKCPYLFTIISDQARPLSKALSLKFTDKLTRLYMKPEQKYLPNLKLHKVFAFDDPGFSIV